MLNLAIILLKNRVYCNNTIEEEKLLKEKMNNTIMVINDTENNLMIDEISGDIIL